MQLSFSAFTQKKMQFIHHIHIVKIYAVNLLKVKMDLWNLLDTRHLLEQNNNGTYAYNFIDMN